MTTMKNAADPRCPECGAPVHLNSQSCGQCGARRGPAGWGPVASHEGLDLSEEPDDGFDDEFDYNEFVAQEFGKDSEGAFLHRMTTKQRFWWLVALLTLIAFVILSVQYPIF